MDKIYKIAKTELQTLFYSPVAWLIIVIFTFQVGMSFTNTMQSWVDYLVQGYKSYGISSDIYANTMRGLFVQVQQYLYLYIPLLTMGLMSRELGSGSIKLLYSSPVTNTQIILGKYVSMMVYGLILMVILFVFVLFGAFTIKDFEWGTILSGMLGLYLLLCAYAAIGLFMSSLTSYQVVAAIGTLAILAVLNFVGGLWQDIAFVRDVTYWLSIGGRSTWFIMGLICSEDVLYFIIVVTLFILLTIIRLQANRQKTNWTVSWSKYVGVFCIAMFLGYLSSRPKLMTFKDVTSTKYNTLTPNSQEVISKLKGGLTITTYTNLLDDGNLWIALPRSVNADLRRFQQYVRFKPEIKLKYVYYYDSIHNPSLDRRYPDLTSKERAEKIAEVYGTKMKLFKTPEQMKKDPTDLGSEGKKFVRSIKRDSGEQTFLRIFDDMMVLPGETEITAALKRLVMDLPIVGFVTGHGERDNNREGDRNYRRFAQDKPFRYSLINQGFDITNISLTSEVPANINILVISDMRSEMNEMEKYNLVKYIARGGNLLIAGEAKRQDVMNPVVEPLGVQFLPGTLVKLDSNFIADFTIAKPTKESGELIYHFQTMISRNWVVSMPSAVGLDYTTDRGFKVTELLLSDSTSWNEMQTTNYIDDTVKFNPELGEIQKAFPTALALSRSVGDKEQRIVILGDADCISNGEISIQRKGVNAANYSIIQGAFYWLSDNEVPIDVRRPNPTDDEIYLTKDEMFTWKMILMWVFSGLLALFAIFLWIRRRGR